jgi:hypothetical protein
MIPFGRRFFIYKAIRELAQGKEGEEEEKKIE